MELKNDIHVISLTHWDREWRFPFAKTRQLLVEMMDSLLETLREDPEYKHFHLDGQTVLLEDYCQARPEQAGTIRQYVQEGRLLIGPWYVLPEENQMSGESLVRNFLWGERIGRKYGGVMDVGYSPTSWGQVSQMPQIFAGFGVTSVIFYRGISEDQAPGNYYLWEGADGTKLFSLRLGDYARAAFFALVDRPVVHNRGLGDQSHDWALGGKPFRICGSGSASPYHFYHPPVGWHPERLEEAFAELEEVQLGTWETPFAMAFECDDSTGPFLATPRIIAEANQRITNGKTVSHASLPESMRQAREHLAAADLPVVAGEMRYPQRAGVWTDLYAEVQAERMPTKYANRRAEFALQRQAEPLATLAWLLGSDYPRFALDRAWSMLLQCHAHDSIGGCGRDAVDADVRHRLAQVQILSDMTAEDAARAIAGRIDTGDMNSEDILLVVFNTLPRPRSEVVRAEIDIAKDRDVRGFVVRDMDGQEVPIQIVDKTDFLATFNHPHELPLRTRSDRWEFELLAEDIPPMGYKVYRVECLEGEMRHPGSMRVGPADMENEHIQVHVNANGSVDVRVKSDGRVLREQNLLEDRGDVGDYWIAAFPMKDQVITSRGCSAEIAVIEDGPLACSIEATVTLDLPVSATQDSRARSGETRPVKVRSVYRLAAGEEFLRISTTIENTVGDHILRALFPTGVDTDEAWAETACDVVCRAIPLPDTRNWREPYKPVQPQQNFVDLSDGQAGVAVLNRGLPQYEAVDDPQRTIALTLLRANRSWNSIRLAHYPDESGSQLTGIWSFDYALLPHEGTWEDAVVHHQAERFNVEPMVGAAGSGEGDLPRSHSFLAIEGDGLVLTACKQGEWDDSLIVRLANPTGQSISGTVRTVWDIESTELMNMKEDDVLETLPAKDKAVAVEVASKKILTLRLQPVRN